MPLVAPPAAPERPTCSLTPLFQQVQEGSESAFSELYARTEARLHAVVLSVLRHRDLAQEVVQEVYLEVWLQRRWFDPQRGPVLGWMTTIAQRRAVDRVRSVTRARSRDSHYAVTDVHPAGADHQDRVVATLDAVAPARLALAELTPLQREAVLLTYWRGQSAGEAALLLGISLPTMKSRLHSALRRMRTMQDQHQPPGDGVALLST